MNRVAAPYLELIRIAIQQIREYTPATAEEFRESLLLQDAVCMRFLEIGENLIRIRRLDDDAFVELAPASWHKIIGLRNVIAHGYEVIKPMRIWLFIDDDLEEFASTIEAANPESGLPLADE
ncbi:MAG: DUF86 domain-containing protein [Thermomicrobiales bacterium]|nr:DUF86 domain-containing protein [Thermomicrobiales bacterium]